VVAVKIGSDFNASKPTDSDYVRHPTGRQLATELRFIKQRMVDFFGRSFTLDSGDLQDNIIPVPALRDSPTSPSSGPDFYRHVTVDRNGFVLSGDTDPVNNTARVFRAAFFSTGSWVETESGIVRNAAVTLQDIPPSHDVLHWVNTSYPPGGLPQGYRSEFIVPDGVTRIRVTLQGGYPRGTSPVSASAVVFDLVVTPAELLEIFVAAVGGITYLARPDYSTYVTSELLSNSPTGAIPTLFGGAFHRNPYRLTADADTVSTPGLVTIEWYA
jgi:hypothetical protein